MKLVTLFVALSIAIFASRAHAQNRAWFADFELTGPLERIVLDEGVAGRTTITGELRAGETRRILVPLPARSESERIEPRIELGTNAGADVETGRVRFLGWRWPYEDVRELAPGLRARPRPALAEAPARASYSSLIWIAAAAATVFALRRRPWWALLAAAVASFASAATGPRASRPDGSIVCIEGDADSARWLRVETSAGRIDVDASSIDFELTVDPPGAPVAWRVELDPSKPWRATAAGARLSRLSTIEPLAPALTRKENAWTDLSSTWTRADGGWVAHGPWARGAALPEERTSTAPPSWLASGLPQGVGVFLGQASATTDERAVWVRIVGF